MEVEENGAPDAEGSPGAGADAGATSSPVAEPKKEIYAAAVAMDVDGGGEAEAADEELPVAAGEAVPPDEAPAEEAAPTADAPAATPRRRRTTRRPTTSLRAPTRRRRRRRRRRRSRRSRSREPVREVRAAPAQPAPPSRPLCVPVGRR